MSARILVLSLETHPEAVRVTAFAGDIHPPDKERGMTGKRHAGTQRCCEGCGEVIPAARLALLSDARFCVGCQEKLERDRHAFCSAAGEDADEDAEAVLQVQGDLIVVGTWTGALMDVSVTHGEVRSMMRGKRWEEARSLVQSLPAEAQAALVTLDENPEEILSLTGMDEGGKPAYRGDVVDRLPTQTLTELIEPRTSRYLRYNPEVLRVMSPGTFARTVHETLDPVDRPDLRKKVFWDWMQAVAAVQDPNKATALLRQVDLDVLEEAILEQIDGMNLQTTGPDGEGFTASRMQALSSGAFGGPPGGFVSDPEIAGILNALNEAAPDLISETMQRVARRLG